MKAGMGSARRWSRGYAFAIIAAAGLLTASCSAAAPHDATSPGQGTRGSELGGSLTVAAAASLQPALETLAADFESEHPGVEFESLTFDGSSVLAAQIISGAPVDVFASADEANMRKVQEAQLVAEDPIPFAKSTLQIAVAPGNPLGIKSLADLAAGASGTGRTPPIVVLCAPAVPCGSAAQTLFDREGVDLTPASEEQNVTAVLTKVANGEADAGLVYRSDVLRAAGDVDGIEIPDATAAAGLYLVAPLRDSNSPTAALAFAEYLRSEHAQTVLARAGFDRA